jgi:hypothetical protein
MIIPNILSSSPYSDKSQSPTNTMNEQPVNGENWDWPIGGDEQFVPRTLLNYTAPQTVNVRSPIRLSRLVGDPPSYGASAISILQNNRHHRLGHEDSHETFLQCSGVVRPNGATEDYIRLSLFPFIIKDRAKRWLNYLPKDFVGT